MHRRLQPQRGVSFGVVMIVLVLIVLFAHLAVKTDAFTVERTNKGFDLNVAYDVQQPSFYNIDVVMHFTHGEAFDKP